MIDNDLLIISVSLSHRQSTQFLWKLNPLLFVVKADYPSLIVTEDQGIHTFSSTYFLMFMKALLQVVVFVFHSLPSCCYH